MIAEEIWWNLITGPSSFVEKISENIRNGNSFAVVLDNDAPWRNQLRTYVERRMTNLEIKLNIIDFADTYKGQSFGEYIIESVDHNSYLMYKPHKQAPEDFISEKKLLNNLVLWIKGIPQDVSIKWHKYIASWNPRHGQLVVEIANLPLNAKLAKTKIVKHIFESDYVSAIDTRLFAFTLASKKGLSSEFQLYAAACSANLCGGDAEVASKLIDQTDFLNNDPVSTLLRIYEYEYCDSPRGSQQGTLWDHPFFLIRNKQTNLLFHRLRKAQVEILFPVIEEERIAFIKDNIDALSDICPKIDFYGMKIDSVLEIDLGFLIYLVKEKKNIKEKIAQISRSSGFERLNELKNIRNKLAHATTCSPEEVRFVLGNHR